MTASAEPMAVTIGDLGTVVTGKTPTSSRPELFGDVYPFITPTDMQSDQHWVETERFLSEVGKLSQKRLLLPTGTVCFVCIGATIGKICLANRPSFTNQQINSVIVDESRFDRRFVYYLLCTKIKDVKGIAGGAATPIVNKTAFSNVEVKIPPLKTQRKIASILSAYDDLIENNTRRIKILEEMAQTIYREWFVNFRFPGHEKVKLVDSPLGMIPEGWGVKPVTESVEVKPRTKVPKEGEKPFVPMGSLSTDSMLISNIETKEGNSGAKFKNGDTLFARITPCLENGKTGFVQFLSDDEATAFGSTEFIVLRSKTLCPEYVYLMARSNEFRDHAIKSMSGATGRQRVSEKCFDQFFIAQPNQKMLDAFSSHIAPMFQKVHILAKKNVNLRQTRDLLLPKLVSGEIDVSDLEIEIQVA
jgi:type I restriction enzyme S subunit